MSKSQIQTSDLRSIVLSSSLNSGWSLKLRQTTQSQIVLGLFQRSRSLRSAVRSNCKSYTSSGSSAQQFGSTNKRLLIVEIQPDRIRGTTSLRVTADFFLSDPDLKSLVAAGKAAYVLRVQSVGSHHRSAHMTQDLQISCTFADGQYARTNRTLGLFDRDARPAGSSCGTDGTQTMAFNEIRRTRRRGAC